MVFRSAQGPPPPSKHQKTLWCLTRPRDPQQQWCFVRSRDPKQALTTWFVVWCRNLPPKQESHAAEFGSGILSKHHTPGGAQFGPGIQHQKTSVVYSSQRSSDVTKHPMVLSSAQGSSARNTHRSKKKNTLWCLVRPARPGLPL